MYQHLKHEQMACTVYFNTQCVVREPSLPLLYIYTQGVEREPSGICDHLYFITLNKDTNKDT